MKSNGKGYIVTNNHVVSGSDEIQVILSDGKKVTAKKSELMQKQTWLS